MRKIILILMAAVAMYSAGQTGSLPRTTAEEQGVSSRALAAFVDTLVNVPRTDIHHLMVVRHGAVIAELHPAPYRADDPHTLYSASKTVTALAVGIAIDENRLRLNDRVAAFFPGELPDSVSRELAAMTVRDLLTMCSGIKPDWNNIRNNHDDWVAQYLSRPVDCLGQFQYDSMCTFLLAAIVQKVTRQTMLDYLRPRLFSPLGITVVDWELSPDGVNTGGWGLRLQAESQAKLGMLINNRGNWNGSQLVSAEWIDEMEKVQVVTATTKSPPTDGNQGYGYQLWRCIPAGVVRADGAFGQYIVMDRERDIVVVINAMSHDGHGMLRAIWNNLLPMLGNTTLPRDKKGEKALAKTLARATLNEIAPVRETKSSRHGGKNHIMLRFEPNDLKIDSLVLDFDGKGLTFTYNDPVGQTFCAGAGTWVDNEVQHPLYSIAARDRLKGLNTPFRCSASFGWPGVTTLEIDQQWPTLISGRHWVIDFSTNDVTVTDSHAPKRNYELKIKK